MSVGLLALLDDVAALAKVAAASLDDVAGQAARAGAKAAGVVIDDTAVTPRYVTGLPAARELPIIAKIAVGSVRNKLVILLPLALALSSVAPWAITPLLMVGGAYLGFEGTEKVYAALTHGRETSGAPAQPQDADRLEDEKVSGAIRTDLILSAEIMAITLAAVPDASLATQAFVLAVVGLGITVGVYGAVALIVKADDIGVALARARSSGPLTRRVGRALVRGTPVLLQGLAAIGTAAMIWVGGGIVLHGLDEFGIASPLTDAIHHGSRSAAEAFPPAGPLLAWLVTAAASAAVGLALGGAAIPLVSRVLSPAWRSVRRLASRPRWRPPA